MIGYENQTVLEIRKTPFLKVDGVRFEYEKSTAELHFVINVGKGKFRPQIGKLNHLLLF
jgi:hypothetical protein